MSTWKCELHCHSTSRHLGQIYAGFEMLRAAGSIELSQRVLRNRTIDYASDAQHLRDAGHAHLDVILNDEKKLHFDTHDSAELAIDELAHCDYYFKRSFSHTHVAQLSQDSRRKVFPLGLNYCVHPDTIDTLGLRRNWIINRGFRKKASGIRQALDAANLLGFLPRLRELELPPDPDADPKVLFLATTYDPNDDPARGPEKAEERRQINDTRAECIRLLRKELGTRFLGGFDRSAFALRHYPDVLIADPRMTLQRNYLRIMKRHSVCIATTGLHGSVGWKLAEYVACSRAILSEPLSYTVPGTFAERSNYLRFESPRECVDKARELIENKELRTQLMTGNAEYYQAHLRPDVLVRNALTNALR
jgi:hypothetical protein